MGSGGRFRKVPESSGVKWCRFRRQGPEGSGEFRCKMVYVPEASSGRFRRVPVYAGVGSGGGFRKVPKGWFRKVSEGSGGFRRVPARVGVGSGRQGSEGSGEFRCGLLHCNHDRSSHVIVLITGITLYTWAKLLRKKASM